MTPPGEVLRQVSRELVSYLRWAARVPDVTMDGIRIRVDYERWSPSMIRRVLAKRYEVEERKLVPRMLGGNERVLEIGGGVGLISMLCARIVGPSNVFVYEANPDIVASARDNVRRNGMDIAIEHAAVVGNDHTGDHVTFFVHEDFWSSSLVNQGGKRVAVSVPAIRLASLIERHGPSVIIADVEGAEYDLLSSVDLSGVEKLCIEFHTRYIGARKASELIRLLLNRGFLLQLEQSIDEVLCFSRPAA